MSWQLRNIPSQRVKKTFKVLIALPVPVPNSSCQGFRKVRAFGIPLLTKSSHDFLRDEKSSADMGAEHLTPSILHLKASLPMPHSLSVSAVSEAHLRGSHR
ncbi:predicted protein [Histoplasma capsulatum var. duboisii H88]|uniref:Predicted protein n=2 Tax=Ajellomyces capsulatus TaxID=5037 RepID=F0UFZ0_AJEC8|nr:predicted protein [Histoplasma capsulatum H143]EGC45039.1 predicted protein [Histoplasma capsulatum var. duboisii H88]